MKIPIPRDRVARAALAMFASVALIGGAIVAVPLLLVLAGPAQVAGKVANVGSPAAVPGSPMDSGSAAPAANAGSPGANAASPATAGVNGAFAPKNWTTHAEPGNPAGSDPLNVVISGNSTVSMTDLMNALGKVQEIATVSTSTGPPTRTIQASWQSVNIGTTVTGFMFSGQCISAMDADVTPTSAQGTTAVPQQISERVGGCLTAANAVNVAHLRAYQQKASGAWFITVSTEKVCYPNGKPWHCVISYDQAANQLVTDIADAAGQQHWGMTTSAWQGAGGPTAGIGSNNVPYSGNVSVITLTR